MSEQRTDISQRDPKEMKRGSLVETLQEGALTAVNTGVDSLNKFLPPERREHMKHKLIEFANERPYLSAFLLLQVLISGFPILLFLVMTITVTVFAITAGLLLGLLGALFFILGSVGFAMIFLLPTLFFTISVAAGIWFWGVVVYYIVRLVNQKDLSNRRHSMNGHLKTRTDQKHLD